MPETIKIIRATPEEQELVMNTMSSLGWELDKQEDFVDPYAYGYGRTYHRYPNRFITLTYKMSEDKPNYQKLIDLTDEFLKIRDEYNDKLVGKVTIRGTLWTLPLMICSGIGMLALFFGIGFNMFNKAQNNYGWILAIIGGVLILIGLIWTLVSFLKLPASIRKKSRGEGDPDYASYKEKVEEIIFKAKDPYSK